MILKEFLDDCRKENVIDETVYTSILDFYKKRQEQFHQAKKIQEQQQKSSSNSGLIMTVGIIGVVLIGFGIIYLFAHNWDQLSRGVKTSLSMVPVLISISASVYTLTKKKGNVIWQETVGISSYFAVGSMLALILQIYQLPGIENYFFFYWCALSLPVVYILQSHGAVFFAIALILLNLISNPYDQSTLFRMPWFGSLVLFASLFPYFKRLFILRKPLDLFIIHQVLMPLVVTLSVIASIKSSAPSVWLMLFLVMSNFLLFGTSIFMRKEDRNPNFMSIVSYIGMNLALTYLIFNKKWNFKDLTNFSSKDYHLVFIPLLFGLLLYQLYIFYKNEKLALQNAYKLLVLFPFPFIVFDFFEVDVYSIFLFVCVLVCAFFVHFSQERKDQLQMYPAMSILAVILFSFVFLSYEKFAIFYISLIPSVYYLIPIYLQNEKSKHSLNAEQILVLSFQFLILIIASFEGFWMEFRHSVEQSNYSLIVLTILIVLVLIGFTYKSFEKIAGHFSGVLGIISVLTPFLIFIGCVLPIGIQHLFTVFLLITGIIALVFGAKQSNLTLANLALGLIGLVLICRFFDLNMSLTLKGIIFILIGASFFASNYIILRNKNNEKIK